ncbi:uncharacterized protein METZ01_LOCUS121644 [marine metagenome]|uniref:Uncharacterized protein n=1 Tax=marine metagenome TaxID=408172 RepID=A0A381XVY1_9ZZZZ
MSLFKTSKLLVNNLHYKKVLVVEIFTKLSV